MTIGRGGVRSYQKGRACRRGCTKDFEVHRRALARARLGEIKPLAPKSRTVGGEVESGQCPPSGGVTVHQV